jgi:singapore isolate B (sub-type 7) whole genome shotgun sequence assembly, scaffold_1
VSNPKRVDVDTKLTEDTIYNTINVDVSKINVLMTNKEENWSRPEVQKEKNLYLVNDFNCNAAIGLSIAPSEPDFATTKVGAKMDVVTIRLERAKYLNLIKYVTGFALNTREIIENSEVDFSSLTAQAKEAASNAMAIRKEDEEKGAADELPSKETAASSKESIQSASEASVQSTSENKASSPSEDKASSSSEDSPKLDLTEYDDSEIRLLQQNKILDIQTYFGGVCVLIEEVSSSNEHTALVESAVRGLEVKVKQRTFDTTVDVSLQAIDVKDCLQSAATRKDTYLVVSKGIDSNGVLSKETTPDLFHVHVGVVNKDSPDYLQVASDVMVEVAFGSLSGSNDR